MTSKLLRVAFAVSLAEGWAAPDVGNQGPEGTVSYRLHNPGNLRVSEYEAGNTGQFAIFNNDLEGFMALVRQLEIIATGKEAAYGDNCTIEQAVVIYTADRDPSPELESYLQTIEQVGGVKRTDLISTIV